MAEQAAALHATGKSLLLRWLRNALAIAVLFVLAAFAVDYAVFRVRMATGHSALGTVTVRPLYAVPQKNRSTEFLVGDPQDQTCVRSLFPHAGHAPCWYLQRRPEQRVDL